MADYTVTKVRKETSSDRTHRHIEGVITASGVHYSRKEVVDSINAGYKWETSAGGYSAIIHTVSRSENLQHPVSQRTGLFGWLS